MIKQPASLISHFEEALGPAGLEAVRSRVEHEAKPAPHKSHSLTTGKCAVYVFSLSKAWGSGCAAGADRVLKVGKAGLTSNARFQSQHYNPNSARSTLAGSLLRCRVLWPYLGIANLTEADVGEWIRKNVDRDNFYLDVSDQGLLGQLETYIRGVLGSMFEGTESRRDWDNA